MANSLFEQMGGFYERQGDYLISCVTLLPVKEQPIGLFGRRHLDYLKQHRRVTYINLLTSGRLNAYLAGIDRQAKDMFFRLVKEYADTFKRLFRFQLVTLSIQRMNIRNAVEEVINTKLIYAQDRL